METRNEARVPTELQTNLIILADTETARTTEWSRTNKWILNLKDLNKLVITEKNPYTGQNISKETLKLATNIIKRRAGSEWLTSLLRIKNYKSIPLIHLSSLKTSGKEIGKGKYATVYNYNNSAVKVVNHCTYKGLPCITGRLEAQILTFLRYTITFPLYSPNIITLYQYTPDARTDYLVLEKMSGTLWSYIQKPRNEKIMKGIIFQVLFTLAILQDRLPGFRHNDLKIDNILVSGPPRGDEPITLKYKNSYWQIPVDVPLIKIADFDYAEIPGKYKNPKVGTSHSASFGCTRDPSKIYDIHLFLNSLLSHRNKIPAAVTKWIQLQLPDGCQGVTDEHVKFARLKNPGQLKGLIKTPVQLLSNKFFAEFKSGPSLPMWGL